MESQRKRHHFGQNRNGVFLFELIICQFKKIKLFSGLADDLLLFVLFNLHIYQDFTFGATGKIESNVGTNLDSSGFNKI